MHNISLKGISYRDLKDNVQIEYNDSYNMLSDCLKLSVRQTLLSNPNLDDEKKDALKLILCNGTVAGRLMSIPTNIKVYDKVLPAQSMGSLKIVEQLRGHGLGTIIFKNSIFNSEYDIYIGQLYSTAAVNILRKLGLIIFELPVYYKICKSRANLEAKGFKGLPLRICSIIVDGVLTILDIPNHYKIKKLKSLYSVKKETVIPAWVNDITLHDGHIFTEVHDSNWLQWGLDNKFTEYPSDHQSFYAVYDKTGKPEGFFMTRVRFEKKQGGLRNIISGTIVEWGSFNENILSETDLNLLAICSFDSSVDNITAVLTNVSFKKKMKKMGFRRRGNFQMSIMPGKLDKLDKDDVSNQSKWRIRYGGCNTIIR